MKLNYDPDKWPCTNEEPTYGEPLAVDPLAVESMMRPTSETTWNEAAQKLIEKLQPKATP